MSSHRQWQDLLVEFTDGLRMANRNGKEVGRKLADAGAAFRGHFTQAGIHGCGSTNFDLLALTFVRLGHAADLCVKKSLYLVPTRQTSELVISAGLTARPSRPLGSPVQKPIIWIGELQKALFVVRVPFVPVLFVVPVALSFRK